MTTKTLLIVLTVILGIGTIMLGAALISDPNVDLRYSRVGGLGLFLMSSVGLILAFLGINTLIQKWRE